MIKDNCIILNISYIFFILRYNISYVFLTILGFLDEGFHVCPLASKLSNNHFPVYVGECS